MPSELIRAVRELRESREPKRWIGTGWMIDYEGIGSSAVSNEPGKVYVRLDRGLSGEQSGEIIKAHGRIRPVVGWAVFVGTTPYRDWEYTVLDVDLEAMAGAIDGAPMLERHHETHEWGPPSGSDDVVYSRFLQLYDFGVWPYSGLTVEVRGGTFDPSGTVQNLTNKLVDLSAYQPAAGCLYALICLSPTGTIEVVPGQVPNGFLTLENVPAAPSTDHWEIAAVRLCAGIDTIRQTPRDRNIVDLRFANLGWAGIKYAGHSPFTLTAQLEDNLLNTSGPVTQILGLDSQPSGTVFAAPTGGDNHPSFRFLTDVDVPDIHAHYPGTIEDGDLAEQYLNEDGSRAGATMQAQDFGANGIKADQIQESTGAAGTYFPDAVVFGDVNEIWTNFHATGEAFHADLNATCWSDTDLHSGRFIARRARGTQASPSAVLSGDRLFALGARGYGATGFVGGNRAQILMEAAENWDDSNQGTLFALYTTPNGSTTVRKIAEFGQDGIINALFGVRTITSGANVSSPPTDAELDGAFGTPATVGDGFAAILDDNGAGAAVWLCVAKNSKWWYTSLTEAV